MIFNLRGCNGSGKTYVVHEILKQFEYSYVIDPTNEEVCGTLVKPLNMIFVGLYRPLELGTGGCDWYLAGNGGSKKTNDDLEDLLQRLATTGRNLFFEGFMISGTFSRWSEFAKRNPTTFLCLDTPLETCIEHIRGRRVRAGNDKPFDGKNVPPHHVQCNRNYKHLAKAGHDVRMIPYLDAPRLVLDAIRPVT